MYFYGPPSSQQKQNKNKNQMFDFDFQCHFYFISFYFHFNFFLFFDHFTFIWFLFCFIFFNILFNFILIQLINFLLGFFVGIFLFVILCFFIQISEKYYVCWCDFFIRMLGHHTSLFLNIFDSNAYQNRYKEKIYRIYIYKWKILSTLIVWTNTILKILLNLN